MKVAALFALLPALASAAKLAVEFKAPAACPTCTNEEIYHGRSNGSLPIAPVVAGKAYDRFITVWLENTDFDSAATSATFQKIAKEGILLTNYNGVTHPSEPNYLAAMTGDFFGMGDDDFYYVPVSSAVDLLESKNISWASYQENMPSDGFDGDYSQKDYLNTTSNATYGYYKRKHNPHIITNSVASIPERALRVRNFNDFAVDVNASALPQHVWVTPNMVNDAHDTDVKFMSSWLEYWLVPLLQNPNFNDNRTLIQLTFDENESYTLPNRVFTVLLGGAVPENLRGTNDTAYYTHYSMLSSIENNWDLPSLGRQDANKTVASVWGFQANQTGWQNYVPQPNEIPMTNLTGIFPGALNSAMWTELPPPDKTAVGAGNGQVFVNETYTNMSVQIAAPVNLTQEGKKNPYMINPNYTYTGHSVDNTSSPAAISASSAAAAAATSSGSTKKPSAASRVAIPVGLSAAVVAVAALL